MPKFPKQQSFVLIIVVAALIIAAVTAAFWSYTQDDVFITYTYSRNIVEGQGFVFNPGERVQGTTTPLYTLLMAGIYVIVPDLLHAGNLLSAIFLVLTCALAVGLVREELSVYGQLAVAATLAASPIMYVSFGMETLLYCALLVLAFWLWKQGQRWAAMIAAAALTWTRADGVVLGGVLWLVAAWDAWQGSKDHPWLARLGRFPWKLAVVYVVGIAPWFGFAWVYFGTPLPNTLSAKQEILQGVKFWIDGFGWWRAFYGNNVLSLIAAPLIGIGLWRAMLRPHLRPLTLWSMFFAAGYTVLNVTAFWYYTPLVAILVVLAVLGGEWLAHLLLRYHLNRMAVLGGSMVLLAVSTVLAIVAAWPYGLPPPRVGTYRLVGQWIDENTPPDSTILVGDLGIMGYYAHRRAIDSPGLITPQMFYKLDSYAAAKFKPDYIVATGYWTWQRLIEQDWFRYHYAPYVQLSTPGDGFSPITVYRRRLDVETPQQAIEGFDLPLNCPYALDVGDDVPGETHARLLSSDAVLLVETAHPFLWDQYPESPARQADHLQEQIALPLAVTPGIYTWEVDCSHAVRSTVEVEPVEKAPGYVAAASPLLWDEFAQLEGFVFPEGADVWSGGSLDIVFHWEALQAAELDYSLFIHVLDVSGKLVAQADGYPRSGSRPTSSWTKDEVIVDPRQILLPPDLPEGEYALLIGWYDWQTGDRLPLADGSDSLRLPVTIRVRWPGGSGLP